MFKTRQNISNSPQAFHETVGKRAAAALKYLAFHVEWLSIERGLRRALEQDEFVVHYQPQVNSSYQVVGVEALVRWQHPRLGLLGPSRFIPFAEETGLIGPIGNWVLETACRQLKQWQESGMCDLDLAVNISARQFHQTDTARTIMGILDDIAIDPRSLTLELTETFSISSDKAVDAALESLSMFGVNLALDDFGKGFSSFDYLRRLPLDIIKVDESFVRNATTDRDDAAVLSAIAGLGRALGLKVIVEGLETREQLRLVRNLRCDAMQGFIFGKPMSADHFQRWMHDDSDKLGSFSDVVALRQETPVVCLSRRAAGMKLPRLAHG
jgi:EAL domain-containing protein (putative c-di-GMP-specific phosphodiesterase class I)